MKTLAIYNLKGGVGKTAAAVNLSHCAAQQGKRTLLIDLDPQGASSFYFEASAHKKFSAKKFAQGKQLDKNIQQTGYEGLDLLPSDFSYRSLDLIFDDAKNPQKALKKVLVNFKATYDLVVMDCPARIGVDAEGVFLASDLILIPVIPTTLSMETLQQIEGFIEKTKSDSTKMRAFFSQVDKRKSLHKQLVAEHAGKNRFLHTTVPFSSEIERMGVYRAPVTAKLPRSRSSLAFRGLWDELAL
jgi:chromosome partitioning protein